MVTSEEFEVVKRLGILHLVVALLIFFSVGTAAADRAEAVQALVEKVAAAFKDKGPDCTLRLLSIPRGPFMKGSIYVSAGNWEGVCLAHPANKKLIGLNLRKTRDAKGKLFVEEMVNVVKETGAGWTEYWWLRHGEEYPTLKRTYVLSVPGQPGELCVCAGYYVK